MQILFVFSRKSERKKKQNINHIYNDHVDEDMPQDEVRKFCQRSWEKPNGFAITDLTSKNHDGKYRYRNGFDNFNFKVIIK